MVESEIPGSEWGLDCDTKQRAENVLCGFGVRVGLVQMEHNYL